MSTLRDFKKHVTDVMVKQSAGLPVGTVYGRKRNGERFALVKTQFVWYAVRLIRESTDIIERKEFYDETAADQYIALKKRKLEKRYH